MTSYNQNVTGAVIKVHDFFTRNFNEILFEGPSLDFEAIQKKPMMLVSTHRSHLDYFLVGWKFFMKGFKNMRFAAGSNLTNLPYIGPRFRRLGAFSVERDTGFERYYVRNLCNSVVSMMEKRETIIVFPEGGRSYSGSMLEIKSGILGASVLTYAKNSQNDVLLLPIAVSYENPPDLPWFNVLLKGKKMRKRDCNFFQKIVGAIYYFGADLLAFLPLFIPFFFKGKLGNVYIDYDEPVAVSALVDIKKNRLEKARDEFSAHRQSMQQVSNAMYERLYKLYRILPQHIVATIIKSEKRITIDKVLEHVEPVLQKIRQESRNCKMVDSMSSEKIIQEGIEKLTALKALHYRAGVLTIRSQNMINYFAATI